jgi:hypothetical protein
MVTVFCTALERARTRASRCRRSRAQQAGGFRIRDQRPDLVPRAAMPKANNPRGARLPSDCETGTPTGDIRRPTRWFCPALP